MKKPWSALLISAAIHAAPAYALPDPEPAPTVPAAPAVAQPTGPADSHFAGAKPIASADLGAVTGQADLAMVVRAQNTSTVSNNSVSGQSQTGAIRFDDRSFSSMNGLSLLSVNTGNNVSINASLNVNIAIQP
ncbi:hypothetical protein [Sphingomonas sp. M1-B02]|uniref:hypothetical protein n=1 Tax=Sphingomonas sp. M1-B02 TaxID=3114300 RepID=UPI002240042A|nr:hypothetical protein [Sphingomonas sp. S6-11]UZK67769.1 hypothetical protein OKW87_08055 [Sphingomonas sp. S6-11]